jgi:hypothetical protein
MKAYTSLGAISLVLKTGGFFSAAAVSTEFENPALSIVIGKKNLSYYSILREDLSFLSEPYHEKCEPLVRWACPMGPKNFVVSH